MLTVTAQCSCRKSQRFAFVIPNLHECFLSHCQCVYSKLASVHKLYVFDLSSGIAGASREYYGKSNTIMVLLLP